MNLTPNPLLAYAIALPLLLLLDGFWLLGPGRPIYMAEIGSLLKTQPNLIAAGAFYVFYAAALVLFAILPGLRSSDAVYTLLLGAALGFAAYGTYDFTNLSVMNGFTFKIAMIDLAWGTFASAVVSYGAVKIFQWWW